MKSWGNTSAGRVTSRRDWLQPVLPWVPYCFSGSRTSSSKSSSGLSRLHHTLYRADYCTNKTLLHIREGHGRFSPWIAFVFAFPAVRGSWMRVSTSLWCSYIVNKPSMLMEQSGMAEGQRCQWKNLGRNSGCSRFCPLPVRVQSNNSLLGMSLHWITLAT